MGVGKIVESFQAKAAVQDSYCQAFLRVLW